VNNAPGGSRLLASILRPWARTEYHSPRRKGQYARLSGGSLRHPARLLGQSPPTCGA